MTQTQNRTKVFDIEDENTEIPVSIVKKSQSDENPTKDLFKIDSSDIEALEHNKSTDQIEFFPEMSEDSSDTRSFDDNLIIDEDLREQKTESLVKNEEKKQNKPQIRNCEQPSTSRGVKFRVKSRNTVTKTSKTRGKKRKVASSVINKPPQDLNETPKPLMTPSQKLFLEFSLICRNKLHGECMGDINCNNNHIFPDARMMCQLLDQMHIFDIDKFIASLYKSIPLSLIYFPELSQFFARRNMKNHLIEAISMAESNVMLLQNYKWIVHGLICCSVTLPKWVSVRILLENRKNFSIHANAVVVDIIAKTETESYFLHQLIDISYATVQIFTVEIFHAYMMKAMQDVRQIDLWEVLIGNILDYLTNQGLNQYFNEQLSSRFVMWLNQRRN